VVDKLPIASRSGPCMSFNRRGTRVAADDPRLAARMSREHTGPDAAAGQPYGS